MLADRVAILIHERAIRSLLMLQRAQHFDDPLLSRIAWDEMRVSLPSAIYSRRIEIGPDEIARLKEAKP